MNPKASLLSLACAGAVMCWVSTATALMETPRDRFRPVRAAELKQIEDVDQLFEFVSRTKYSALLMDVNWSRDEDFHYVIVRLCEESDHDWCATAVFNEQISSETLLGVAMLPDLSTFSDVSFRLCEGCPITFSLIFVSSDGREKAILLSSAGVVF